MPSQVFKIVTAPEAPPITALTLRAMLYDLRKDTEFEVTEIKEPINQADYKSNAGYPGNIIGACSLPDIFFGDVEAENLCRCGKNELTA
jgi:hypothetical protein